MKVEDTVEIWSANGFEQFAKIIAATIPCDFDKQKQCFRLFDGSVFYAEPDPETGKQYNVGNRMFWIRESPAPIKVGEEVALMIEGKFDRITQIVANGIPYVGDLDQLCYRVPAIGRNTDELFFMRCDHKGRYYSVNDNGRWLERIGRIYG